MWRAGLLAAAGALLSLTSRTAGAGGGDDDRGSEVWLTESESGLSPAAEAAGPLPFAHWRTMFTRHFRIHFYDEERALADRAALIAERAHLRLTQYLNWLPSGRIDITLNDQTDDANGFASSVPQNYLFGYGAPPASLDELNDFDDWFNLLITHELTHVVHLDTILGPARYINCPARQDLRTQPVTADLVRRGVGGADGVAPDHGRPGAQHLLRHGAARADARGEDAGPRRGVERPPRLPAGIGGLPLRVEPAQVHRGPLRARQDPGDLASLRQPPVAGRAQPGVA